MFAKLAVIILTIGAVAATLLAARQQRLCAVHESAEAMRRIVDHDRTLWRLRGEIASRVTPSKVKKMADHFGPLVSLFTEHSSSLHPAPGEEQRIRRTADGREIPPSPQPKREAAAPSDAADQPGQEDRQ